MKKSSEGYFSYNLFKQGSDRLLAVCDNDILGNTFSGKDMEMTVSDFYRGRTCGEKDILEIMATATIINAVGNKIVALLIDKGFVNKSAVLKIGDVLHAHVISLVYSSTRK